MKITRIIRAVEKRLTWPVSRATHAEPLDIISDPFSRVHTISFPSASIDPVRPIEYLHELAHATLAEKHPIFCVHEFIAQGLDINEALLLLSDPIRATGDWFADDLVMKWARAEQAAYIREHVELMLGIMSVSDVSSDMVFAAAHILAQGVHYLGISIPSRLRSLSGFASPHNAFLSVPPSKPTTANFSRLFNLLITLRGLYAAWTPSESAWIVKNL